MQKQQMHNNDSLSSEELKYLKSFRDLMIDFDSEHELGESVAADLTKIWASCFDDTWVWGGQ